MVTEVLAAGEGRKIASGDGAIVTAALGPEVSAHTYQSDGGSYAGGPLPYPVADELGGLRGAHTGPAARAALDTPLVLFLDFPDEALVAGATCRLWLAEVLSPHALKVALWRRPDKEDACASSSRGVGPRARGGSLDATPCAGAAPGDIGFGGVASDAASGSRDPGDVVPPSCSFTDVGNAVLGPAARRRLWWLLALDIAEGGYKQQAGIGRSMYGALASAPSECDESIRRDLARTFPNVPLLKTSEGREQLFRVLRAAANDNPEVGYCQGMNFVAAGLLVVLREEEAAWETLQRLRKRLDLDELFRAGFPRLKILVFCFDALVEAFLPNVHVCLALDQISSEYYATPWWLTLFAADLPLEGGGCFAVWDLIFVHGWKAVFRVGLALLWAAEARLLACEGSDERLQLLRRIARGRVVDALGGPIGLARSALAFGVSNRMCRDLESCMEDPDVLLPRWFSQYKTRFQQAPPALVLEGL